MQQMKQFLTQHMIDLLLVFGAALISVGIGLIYLPAGLIGGGALTIAGAALAGLGRGNAVGRDE